MAYLQTSFLLGGFILFAAIPWAGEICLGAPEPSPVQPEKVFPYAGIDRHALAAPPEAETALESLADYLVQPAKNDRQRARAIFRWMCDRIRFDSESFFTGLPGPVSAEEVLRERKATGPGYAALLEALARQAGLEAVTIPGQARMKHWTEEGRQRKVPHAWNAVKADRRWQLLDAAWGSGFLKGQRWRQVFQEQYFLTPPEQMVLTHLPADPRWQLLAVPVTPEQFLALRPVNARYFRLGLNHETALKVHTPDCPGWGISGTTEFYLQAGKVKVLAAPPAGVLPPGQPCYFVIEAPHVAAMALCNNDRRIIMRKTGNRFEGLIVPETGELSLCLQRPNNAVLQTVRIYSIDPRSRNAKIRAGAPK